MNFTPSVPAADTWESSLENSKTFSVATMRRRIDQELRVSTDDQIRWNK